VYLQKWKNPIFGDKNDFWRSPFSGGKHIFNIFLFHPM
jgi:hypothetical protein